MGPRVYANGTNAARSSTVGGNTRVLPHAGRHLRVPAGSALPRGGGGQP